MKYLLTVLVLVTGVTQAQEQTQEQQENKKRPSWSQGLPERQAALKPVSKGLRNPAESNVDHTPEIESIEMQAPALEVQLITTPIKMPATTIENPTEDTQSPAVNSRKKALEQYYSSEPQTTVAVNPLIAEYNWQVLKTTPIELPSDYSSDSLVLNIQINPKGKVTKVTVADSNIPDLVLEYAEKSIRKWRFQPPGDIGITENISKVFTIDIKT